MIDVRQYMASGKPRNILGFVISLAVVMLVLWLFVVSRMDYQSNDAPDPNTTAASQERIDSVRVMMGRTDTVVVEEDRSSNIFFNALTTFVVLLILLGGVWLWSRKKLGSSTTKGTYFRDIGEHAIGPGQQLKVIEINNEIWVLGVGADSVTLLHRYPKDQWKEEIPAGHDHESRSFYDMFSGKS